MDNEDVNGDNMGTRRMMMTFMVAMGMVFMMHDNEHRDTDDGHEDGVKVKMCMRTTMVTMGMMR